MKISLVTDEECYLEIYIRTSTFSPPPPPPLLLSSSTFSFFFFFFFTYRLLITALINIIDLLTIMITNFGRKTMSKI